MAPNHGPTCDPSCRHWGGCVWVERPCRYSAGVKKRHSPLFPNFWSCLFILLPRSLSGQQSRPARPHRRRIAPDMHDDWFGSIRLWRSYRRVLVSTSSFAGGVVLLLQLAFFYMRKRKRDARKGISAETCQVSARMPLSQY